MTRSPGDGPPQSIGSSRENPNGRPAARSRFRLAELLESNDDFAGAARSYLLVAILLLHEELSPESLWRAGQCFEKAGDPEQAKRAYEDLVKEFPETERVSQAKERMAALGA